MVVIFKEKKPTPTATKFWRCYTALIVQKTGASSKKQANVFSLSPTCFAATKHSKKCAFALATATLKKNPEVAREKRIPGNIIKRKRGRKMYNFPDAFLMKKFVNLLMIAGKKSVAYKIFCAAGFEFLQSTEKGHKIKSVAAVPAVLNTHSCLAKASLRSNPKGSLTKSQHACSSSSFIMSGGGQLKRLRKKKLKKREKVRIQHRNKNRFLLKMRTVIRNVQPSVEGRKCRLGRNHKWVPAIVPYKRGCSLAMRWIIDSARKRKKNSKLPMHRCLAQEFLDAYQKGGRPRQRRDELHKLCEGNRGFLRYRWW